MPPCWVALCDPQVKNTWDPKSVGDKMPRRARPMYRCPIPAPLLRSKRTQCRPQPAPVTANYAGDDLCPPRRRVMPGDYPMKQPRECELHVLDHMKSTCGACADCQCQWRDAMRDPSRGRSRTRQRRMCPSPGPRAHPCSHRPQVPPPEGFNQWRARSLSCPPQQPAHPTRSSSDPRCVEYGNDRDPCCEEHWDEAGQDDRPPWTPIGRPKPLHESYRDMLEQERMRRCLHTGMDCQGDGQMSDYPNQGNSHLDCGILKDSRDTQWTRPQCQRHEPQQSTYAGRWASPTYKSTHPSQYVSTGRIDPSPPYKSTHPSQYVSTGRIDPSPPYESTHPPNKSYKSPHPGQPHPIQQYTSTHPSQHYNSTHPSQHCNSTQTSQPYKSIHPSPPNKSIHPITAKRSTNPSPPNKSMYPIPAKRSTNPSPTYKSTYPSKENGSYIRCWDEGPTYKPGKVQSSLSQCNIETLRAHSGDEREDKTSFDPSRNDRGNKRNIKWNTGKDQSFWGELYKSCFLTGTEDPQNQSYNRRGTNEYHNNQYDCSGRPGTVTYENDLQKWTACPHSDLDSRVKRIIDKRGWSPEASPKRYAERNLPCGNYTPGRFESSLTKHYFDKYNTHTALETRPDYDSCDDMNYHESDDVTNNKMCHNSPEKAKPPSGSQSCVASAKESSSKGCNSEISSRISWPLVNVVRHNTETKRNVKVETPHSGSNSPESSSDEDDHRPEPLISHSLGDFPRYKSSATERNVSNSWRRTESSSTISDREPRWKSRDRQLGLKPQLKEKDRRPRRTLVEKQLSPEGRVSKPRNFWVSYTSPLNINNHMKKTHLVKTSCDDRIDKYAPRRPSPLKVTTPRLSKSGRSPDNRKPPKQPRSRSTEDKRLDSRSKKQTSQTVRSQGQCHSPIKSPNKSPTKSPRRSQGQKMTPTRSQNNKTSPKRPKPKTQSQKKGAYSLTPMANILNSSPQRPDDGRSDVWPSEHQQSHRMAKDRMQNISRRAECQRTSTVELRDDLTDIERSMDRVKQLQQRFLNRTDQAVDMAKRHSTDSNRLPLNMRSPGGFGGDGEITGASQRSNRSPKERVKGSRSPGGRSNHSERSKVSRSKSHGERTHYSKSSNKSISSKERYDACKLPNNSTSPKEKVYASNLPKKPQRSRTNDEPWDFRTQFDEVSALNCRPLPDETGRYRDDSSDCENRCDRTNFGRHRDDRSRQSQLDTKYEPDTDASRQNCRQNNVTERDDCVSEASDCGEKRARSGNTSDEHNSRDLRLSDLHNEDPDGKVECLPKRSLSALNQVVCQFASQDEYRHRIMSKEIRDLYAQHRGESNEHRPNLRTKCGKWRQTFSNGRTTGLPPRRDLYNERSDYPVKQSSSNESYHSRKCQNDIIVPSVPEIKIDHCSNEGSQSITYSSQPRSLSKAEKTNRDEKSNRSRDEKSNRSRDEKSNHSRDEKTNYSRDEKTNRSRDEKTNYSRDEKTNHSCEGKTNHSRDEKPARSYGDRENHPCDEKQARSYDDRTNHPRGEKPAHSYDEKSVRSYGDKTNYPCAEKPARSYDEKSARSYGDRTNRPCAEKPARSYDEKSARSYGDRTNRPCAEKPARSYDEMSARSYGDRTNRPCAEKPARSYGDRTNRPCAEKITHSREERTHNARDEKSTRSYDERTTNSSEEGTNRQRVERTHRSHDDSTRLSCNEGKNLTRDERKNGSKYSHDDKTNRSFSGRKNFLLDDCVRNESEHVYPDEKRSRSFDEKGNTVRNEMIKPGDITNVSRNDRFHCVRDERTNPYPDERTTRTCDEPNKYVREDRSNFSHPKTETTPFERTECPPCPQEISEEKGALDNEPMYTPNSREYGRCDDFDSYSSSRISDSETRLQPCSQKYEVPHYTNEAPPHDHPRDQVTCCPHYETGRPTHDRKAKCLSDDRINYDRTGSLYNKRETFCSQPDTCQDECFLQEQHACNEPQTDVFYFYPNTCQSNAPTGPKEKAEEQNDCLNREADRRPSYSRKIGASIGSGKDAGVRAGGRAGTGCLRIPKGKERPSCLYRRLNSQRL